MKTIQISCDSLPIMNQIQRYAQYMGADVYVVDRIEPKSNDKNLDTPMNLIINILDKNRVSRNLFGYKLLVEAILMTYNQIVDGKISMQSDLQICNIYIDIGAMHNISWNAVEKNIRTAIKSGIEPSTNKYFIFHIAKQVYEIKGGQ